MAGFCIFGGDGFCGKMVMVQKVQILSTAEIFKLDKEDILDVIFGLGYVLARLPEGYVVLLDPDDQTFEIVEPVAEI